MGRQQTEAAIGKRRNLSDGMAFIPVHAVCTVLTNDIDTFEAAHECTDTCWHILLRMACMACMACMQELQTGTRVFLIYAMKMRLWYMWRRWVHETVIRRAQQVTVPVAVVWGWNEKVGGGVVG